MPQKYPQQIFVVREAGDGAPYLLAHESLDAIDEECEVATYTLVERADLKIKRELV